MDCPARPVRPRKGREIPILPHQIAVLQREATALRVSWAGRAALAAVAGLLPSSHLRRLRLIISRELCCNWHADLVRQRWAYPRRALERPRSSPSVRALLLEMARDNPGWGTKHPR